MRAFLVRLPSGVRYWTVLGEDLAVVAEADAFLRHVRFGRDGSELDVEPTPPDAASVSFPRSTTPSQTARNSASPTSLAAPGSTAPSSTVTATCSNASTPPTPSHPTSPKSAPRSPVPHCKPTCSQPSNAAPAWPHAPTNSRNAYPNCSANKPGAQPDSVPPPTSTSFSNAS